MRSSLSRSSLLRNEITLWRKRSFPIVAAGLGHQLLNCLPGRLLELAQELSVVEEVEPNQLGNGEDPLRVTDLFEDLLAKKRTGDGRPLPRTGGTEHTPATGEGDQVLRPTLVAVDPGKASLEVAAGLEGQHHAVDEAAPEAVGALETLLPRALDLLVEVVDEPRFPARYRKVGGLADTSLPSR